MITDNNNKVDPKAVGQWLEAYGDSLYRFAFLRTRQHESAEDLVQETLLGAMRTTNPPDGRASEKTWLFGILKHKIADHMRSCARSALDQRIDHDEDEDGDIETAVFRADGHWREPSSPWGNPTQHMESQGFWHALTSCLQTLPTAQSQMFVLREIEELTIDEAAHIAGVTATNVYVLLHRARLALRQCLQHAGLREDHS